MTINFFDKQHQEPPRKDFEFGLCDDQNGAKAYSTEENHDKWVATVKNAKRKSIIFTAIDNNITVFKENETGKESTCDGMLTFKESLFLIELKNRASGGYEKAKSQLTNTILLMDKYNKNEVEKFKFRKAFVANKHPYFVKNSAQEKRLFSKDFKFILEITSNVKVS